MNFLNPPFYLTGETTARALARLQPKNSSNNVLSLRDLEFIDPFGLVLTLSYLRYLSMVVDRISLYLPKKDQVLYYLQRSGFLTEAEKYAALVPSQRLRFLHPNGEEPWLIPITVMKQEEDVADLVVMMMKNMKRMLQNEEKGLSRDQLQICTLLSEVCQNVPQHSGDFGIVAAQTYRIKQTGGRSIHFAIADLGIGLRGSLSVYHPVKDWSDEAIIRYALRLGVSGTNEAGRGFGLTQVVKALERMNGVFYLRSGNGLYVRNNVSEFYYPCGFFPGVQVSLVINT
ncbi:MAG TPA: ATP-binding protein [Bacillota bacterium]|nr:ATP-binding protein [Bacillota bacterium]